MKTSLLLSVFCLLLLSCGQEKKDENKSVPRPYLSKEISINVEASKTLLTEEANINSKIEKMKDPYMIFYVFEKVIPAKISWSTNSASYYRCFDNLRKSEIKDTVYQKTLGFLKEDKERFYSITGDGKASVLYLNNLKTYYVCAFLYDDTGYLYLQSSMPLEIKPGELSDIRYLSLKLDELSETQIDEPDFKYEAVIVNIDKEGKVLGKTSPYIEKQHYFKWKKNLSK